MTCQAPSFMITSSREVVMEARLGARRAPGVDLRILLATGIESQKIKNY